MPGGFVKIATKRRWLTRMATWRLPLAWRRWLLHRASWLPDPVGTPLRFYFDARLRVVAVHDGNPNWHPPKIPARVTSK